MRWSPHRASRTRHPSQAPHPFRPHLWHALGTPCLPAISLRQRPVPWHLQFGVGARESFARQARFAHPWVERALPGWPAGTPDRRICTSPSSKEQVPPEVWRDQLGKERPMRLMKWIMAIALCAAMAIDASAVQAKVPGPNGRIAFARFDTALPDTVIYTANSDGSNVVQLLDGAAEAPHWSPDGTLVAVLMSGQPP